MQQIVLARQYIGYFQTGYKALIGFMVLLVLRIILINRNIRGATRGLGIDFLIYGALEFAGVYVARNYALMSLPICFADIPSSLQPWLSGYPGDLLAPLQMFSLGLLIGGVVLLVFLSSISRGRLKITDQRCDRRWRAPCKLWFIVFL